MKKLFAFMLGFMLVTSILGSERVVIVSEDFENQCSLFTNKNGSFYNDASISYRKPLYAPISVSGSYSIGVSWPSMYLTSIPINTIIYTDIMLQYRLSALSLDTSDGMDPGDYVWTQIKKKSDTQFTDYIKISGSSSNNSYWSYTGGIGIASTVYPNIATYQPSGSGERTTDGYSTVIIYSLPSDEALQISIIARSSSSTELWLIDDFKLTGIPIPLSAPVITQPTAISYEGFTAHWNAVQYATSYSIQLSTTNTFEEILWESDPTTNLLYRVQNLEPEITYYYRIKASNVATASEFSDVYTVTTSTMSIGYGSGTIIDGNSVNIIVAPLSGFTNNNVEIIPTQPTNADFTVSVNQIGNKLIYNIACSEISHLNGSYILHHEGSTLNPNCVNVSNGYINEWSTENGVTNLSVDGISTKGSLCIILQEENTLPVELTNFRADIDYRNRIRLQWVTQSEANLLGYYVYRNSAEDFSNATIVSPMIEATNIANLQIYTFIDETVNTAGNYYYWLNCISYNGKDELFGPAICKYEFPETGSGLAIPLQEGIRGIYPNPFNPETTINYELESPGSAEIAIYNFKGQRVINKTFDHSGKGSYKYLWNGCDDKGRICGSGIYTVVVRCGEKKYFRKVALVK